MPIPFLKSIGRTLDLAEYGEPAAEVPSPLARSDILEAI